MNRILVNSYLLTGIIHSAQNQVKKSLNITKDIFGSKIVAFNYLSVNSVSKNMASSGSKSSMNTDMSERLVWVDLEMTGLNIDKERIMEAAVIVTDSNLVVIKEGPNIVIKVEDHILDNMNEWCKKHHGESGLTDACRKSDITLSMAEDQILKFVAEHTEPGKAPLAGNSVHADKKFIDRFMPKLMSHLHYRIVDVSTIKEICRRWYSEEYKSAPKKQLCHRALDDIKESIEELKYYRSSIFK